jgi:hypothetical protein
MLPFGVTIPATVPQGSEIPEGLMNNPVLFFQQRIEIPADFIPSEAPHYVFFALS